VSRRKSVFAQVVKLEQADPVPLRPVTSSNCGGTTVPEVIGDDVAVVADVVASMAEPKHQIASKPMQVARRAIMVPDPVNRSFQPARSLLRHANLPVLAVPRAVRTIAPQCACEYGQDAQFWRTTTQNGRAIAVYEDEETEPDHVAGMERRPGHILPRVDPTEQRVLGVPLSWYKHDPVDLSGLRHPMKWAKWRLKLHRMGPYAPAEDESL
jgi:hypothetical protein